jgi:hypothetical protein
MTKEEFDSIRENWNATPKNGEKYLYDLLAEVERLKAREESLVKQSVAQIGLSGWQYEQIERLTAERDRARNMLEGICSEFEGVVAHADWKAAGSKGMSVPFRGDFASAVQLPSLVGRMRWWANEMRKVIDGKVE